MQESKLVLILPVCLSVCLSPWMSVFSCYTNSIVIQCCMLLYFPVITAAMEWCRCRDEGHLWWESRAIKDSPSVRLGESFACFSYCHKFYLFNVQRFPSVRPRDSFACSNTCHKFCLSNVYPSSTSVAVCVSCIYLHARWELPQVIEVPVVFMW